MDGTLDGQHNTFPVENCFCNHCSLTHTPTLSCPTKMAGSTQLRYVHAWTGRYVFHRSCANLKWEVVDINIGIPIDFRSVNAFPCITINYIVNTFHNISFSTNLYNSYLTRILQNAVFNNWLVSVTDCGLQSTACGIELNGTSLGLV